MPYYSNDSFLLQPDVLQKRNISENHEFLLHCNNTEVNISEEKIMSEIMTKLLNRLTEILPRSDYQSRLEEFIESRRPTSIAEVEHWERYFHRNNAL